MKALKTTWLGALLFSAFSIGYSAELDKEVKKKVDAKIAVLSDWGSQAEIVKAVKAQNAAKAKGIENEKWKSFPVLNPEVREYSSNAVATWIKAKKDESITECFVNAANGEKVAFLSKPTSFNHKGKPKHDVPMSGKIWTGELEQDQSTGKWQIQIGIPVMDAKKAIGSIVVGIDIDKL